MRWIKKYQLFKESKVETAEIKSKNPILEICTSMVLLNNEFLDKILNLGLKARYTENSEVFLNDLKNLLNRNRLYVGKVENNKFVIDDDSSKVNAIFNNVKFSIEEDIDILNKSRDTARNISEKIFPGEKLESDRIEYIFLNLSKTKDYNEDIVIETTDGKQYSFFLNKNLGSQKSASFNTFADDLIGPDIDILFNEEYIKKWNKLTQEWVKIIYENSNKNIQQHIEKFVDPKRIDTIGYFEYFDIKHRDPRFKHLGEFIREFDKNILKFPDLLSEIWKNRDTCFMDPERIYGEWSECKIAIMNSRILEHLLTTSLKISRPDDITKQDDGFKLASGPVKMKLFKTIIEKMGCLERSVYYLYNNGNIFTISPDRQFFREFYDDLDIKFDYHVNFAVSEEEENNDFCIKIKVELDGENLIDMIISVKFTGGEMSGKLGAKYKFDLNDSFNYMISKKRSKEV